MERPRPATIAWACLAGGIAVYDLLAPQGETLSEGVDRALERPIGRYAAIGAVALTAAHLLNALPDKLDPFHLVFEHAPHIAEK